MVAALNGLDVQGADVQQPFLSAKNLEKYWIEAGPEFGPNQGKIYIDVRALYGLNSASVAFRSVMVKKLYGISFRSCNADPAVWLRLAVKPNGDEYYEYVLCYVDDILPIGLDPKKTLESLKGDTVKLKNNKIENPDMYLGARLQLRDINGHSTWSITSVDYIKATIATVREALKDRGRKFPGTTAAKTPIHTIFVPE